MATVEFLVETSDLTYGPTSKVAEVGAIVSDLPSESIGWLEEQGFIRRLSPAEAKEIRAAARVAVDPTVPATTVPPTLTTPVAPTPVTPPFTPDVEDDD